jgi:glycogen synthase
MGARANRAKSGLRILVRIWLLTSELPQETAGGIGRYVENWARLLGAAGHDVTIIARTDYAKDEVIAPGVRLVGIPPRSFLRNEPNPQGLPDTHPAYPFNVLSYWPALSYQMAEAVLQLLQRLPHPDIIESQEYSGLPYFLLQRKLTEHNPLAHIPILVCLHGPMFEITRANQEPRFRFPTYWVGQMEKFCLIAADAVLSPSDFAARSIERTLERSLNFTCVPHPLAIHREMEPQHAQLRQLVYVGRLQALKGVPLLVNACQRLWEAGEHFQLTLVGGDAEFALWETTVGAFLQQRYGQWITNGRLKLIGEVDHPTVLDFMKRAWAVVVPSLWESFSYTCMEAMAVGQVVIASRSGGQAEQIEANGVNGFLFDWHTPGDFERQLRAVLRLDVRERELIARRAQARIRAWCDPERIMAQKLRQYEETIARHTPRRVFPTLNETPRMAVAVEAYKGEQRGLLSVIVPYYNLGEYVQETLNSILATAYTPREVVIVNDGSTDLQSIAVLADIERHHAAVVRVVHTRNQGLASARNIGAEAAHGEFLAFVDADDLVEPDFFSRAVDVLQQYANVDVVYSWLRYFGENSDLWPTWNMEAPYLLGHNMAAILAVLRRSTFLSTARHKPHFEYNFEDFETWVTLLEAGGVGVSLPYPLARYRVRPGSLFRSANREQFLFLHDEVSRYHPESYRNWGVELFNLQNANGPGYAWPHPAGESGEPPQAYIATLEQLRDRLDAEARTLRKAWDDHRKFIVAQRTYIQDLEARCGDLVAKLGEEDAMTSIRDGAVAWRDYEIGGRLASRVRRSWVVRQALRLSTIKNIVKRAIE